MAEKLTVELEVKNEKAKKALEEFGDQLEDTGRKGKAGAEAAKKDWKGLGELFTGILPRNIQGLLRGFKATQRGVKGLSRSFKVLKTAWASIGIGAIIMGLEALADNWETVTDWLGITSEAQRRQEKVQQSQIRATAELNAQTTGYVQVLTDRRSSEEAVASAVERLNQQLGGVIDTEATRQEQLEQATAAIEAKRKAEEAELKVKELQNARAEHEIELREAWSSAEFKAAKAMMGTAAAYNMFVDLKAQGVGIEEDLIEATKELEAATRDFNRMQEESAALIKERQEAARAEAQAEKDAEAAAKRRAEARKKILAELAEYEADYRARLLGGEEEVERQRMQRRHKEEMEEAKSMRLRHADRMRLLEKHKQEEAELEKKFQDEKDRAEESALERIDQALMTNQQKQIHAITEHYQELIDLAVKYGRDTVALEAQRDAEIAAIQDGSADREIKELTALYALRREMELLDMDERAARFEKQRDDAKELSQDRIAVAMAGHEKEMEAARAMGMDTTELEAQHAALLTDIRRQLTEDLLAIDGAERDSFKESRREMIESAMEFADNVGGVMREMQALRDANTEAAILEAKERGASDEEIAAIERAAAERERKHAIGQVLLAQAQSLASALMGATEAAAATGPAAPFALAGYIATMVGSVIAGFAQIKSIMNEARAADLTLANAGGGGPNRAVTQALDPNLATDFANSYTGEGGAPDPIKTYVVLSDIQGQQADYDTISSNATL